MASNTKTVTFIATDEKTSSVKYVPSDDKGYPLPYGHGITSAIYLYKHELATLQGLTNADVAEGRLPIPPRIDITLTIPPYAQPAVVRQPVAPAQRDTVAA